MAKSTQEQMSKVFREKKKIKEYKWLDDEDNANMYLLKMYYIWYLHHQQGRHVNFPKMASASQ